MATAIIFGAPGSGKTVNSTTLPGKTLLLSSDNSAVVLKKFDRPNLTVKVVTSFKEYVDEFDKATESKKYDHIITDCLTDIIDAFIVECRESGKFNDIRQAYMLSYTKIKALVRRAAYCDTHCVFNCWEDVEQVTAATGDIVTYRSPMLPAKIKQQVCGLCNVIAYVATATKDNEKRWYYILEGNQSLMCKDQLFIRKSCLPENLFTEV